MKLRKIEIEKFRTIDSIKFDIDAMAVLIGENNSGKSNILKAIDLFYEDSVRGINEEYFYFKDRNQPISVILTFGDLTQDEKDQKYLKFYIFKDQIRIKKEISYNFDTGKYSLVFYAWQAAPVEDIFNLNKFDEYKSDVKKIVEQNNLPNYFRNDKGNVTQSSYKDGVKKHIDSGLVTFGDPVWFKNPGGLKEVFSSLLPRFYLVPAVKDAQDESKTTQQTVFGKLITDLTNRIILKNPQFELVKNQIEGLKKYLNKNEDGDESERLQEIKDLEKALSTIISESMPGSKVNIEIITPELIDLFKDTKISIDDSLPTSIDSKGHGLQRALIFAYIRAYAQFINSIENDDDSQSSSVRNFILGVEEPELFLHPNGQRKMMNVLSNISKTDQVITCTHSNFFVDMYNYNDIVIVKRENNGPTFTYQYKEDIFKSEEKEVQKRLKKVFRYLSMFDLSRSEMFFSRKVILVEGDTEKFIIPFWATKLAESDEKYDFSSKNICVIECGGKTNIHVFMRVLTAFKIPFIVIHDVDPISFPIDKPDKTDKEKNELRMFRENEFIEKTLDSEFGKIIRINPELEPIIGVSSNQVSREGKVGAAFFKYDTMDLSDYPVSVKSIVDLCINWNIESPIFELSL